MNSSSSSSPSKSQPRGARIRRLITNRPNRDADCARMRLLFRWNKWKEEKKTMGTSDKKDPLASMLDEYNMFWSEFGASITQKDPREVKSYIIVKITEDIASDDFRDSARRYIIQNSPNTIDMKFFNEYVATRHRTSISKFSTTRRLYRSSTSSSTSSSKKKNNTQIQQIPIPAQSAFPVEFIEFTIPIVFGKGVHHSSLLSF